MPVGLVETTQSGVDDRQPAMGVCLSRRVVGPVRGDCGGIGGDRFVVPSSLPVEKR